MKKIYILVSLFTVLFASAQPQDSLFVWKAGVMIHKQSIKPADMDSITFKRPVVNPNGINIAGPNVTDIDGNTYQSVTNCGLAFTKQNLNVSKYSDGTPIPQVQDQTAWAGLTTGAWCYYNNDPANGAVYGKLYNWYAVVGIYDAASLANPALRKKLAPAGWHVPTDPEWTQLTDCLGGQVVAGGKMKSTGTIQEGTGLWESPNAAATNESGFSGLPSGFRYNGSFYYIGSFGTWWSSSEASLNSAWGRSLGFNGGYFQVGSGANNEDGYSVRCLRD
jgi:uncharacterized protein (TIGR02145 family)